MKSGGRAAWFISFLLLAQIFSLGSSAPARQTNQERQNVQKTVTVTLKLVRVTVTDKKANPITGLEKRDFELYDNSRPAEIAAFEKYVSDEPDSKEHINKEKTKISGLRTANRKYFLFFDFAFNNKLGIKKSKEAAFFFIDNYLQKVDEIGIISYSTLKQLVVHTDLTIDHQKARQIIELLQKNTFGAFAPDVEEEYWKYKNSDYPKTARPENSKWDLDRYLTELKIERSAYLNHVSFFSANMKELAQYLSAIPGLKNVLLFSSGIAASAIYDTPASALHRDENDIGTSFRLSVEYENALRNLAVSNSAVYILDSGQLASPLPKSKAITGSAPLKRLSQATGGEYFDSLKDYKKIEKNIVSMTGSYYVLGFYVDEKWDNLRHKIEVKVRRKGSRVCWTSAFS